MSAATTIAICSHRLGGTDGVSIEAAKWQRALLSLGYDVRTVAGSGRADILLEGLDADAASGPSLQELERAFSGCDLVIVENVCSLKLNAYASNAVTAVLGGRRAIFHHHDLAIERPDRLHLGPPRDDAAWTHVCISDNARHQLAQYDIVATRLYNHFDPFPPIDNRSDTRARLQIGSDELLVLQPTRAIARKAIAVGVALAESLGATYWLLGGAEDGYDDELDRILRAASTRVLRGMAAPITIDDAYAASDLVALPSTWEGFGNPTVESATHRRPLAIGTYPVADELRQLGFRWFSANDPRALLAYFENPDPRLIDDNAALADQHFSIAQLPRKLQQIFQL